MGMLMHRHFLEQVATEKVAPEKEVRAEKKVESEKPNKKTEKK